MHNVADFYFFPPIKHYIARSLFCLSPGEGAFPHWGGNFFLYLISWSRLKALLNAIELDWLTPLLFLFQFKPSELQENNTQRDSDAYIDYMYQFL